MKDYLKSKNILYIGIVAMILAFLIVPNIKLNHTKIFLELKTPTKGSLQIFYSKERGYSEEKSIWISLNHKNKYHFYKAELKYPNLKHLRIDPPGNIILKSISFKDNFQDITYKGNKLYKLIEPLHDIKKIDYIKNEIRIYAQGKDPYFQLKNIPVLNKTSFKTKVLVYFIVLIILFTIISALWIYLPEEKKLLNTKLVFKSIIILIFGWFAFQGIYYSTNIANDVSPDESYHYELSKLHLNSLNPKIKDTPETFYLGAISVRPYLYHFLMGKLLMLNIFNIAPLIFLRLINVILGLISLYLTFLVAKEISDDKWVQILVLIIQTNILMYVFINSMVSYDNLINLISTGSFLVLLRFLKSYSRKYLILLLLTFFAGTLTKITYGPIVIIQIIILLRYFPDIIRHRKNLLAEPIGLKETILFFLVIFLLGLNIELYGNNIAKYHQIQPKTESVIDKENALKYYGQAKRSDQLKKTLNTRKLMSTKEYLIKYYFRTTETITGIMGHKNLFRTTADIFCYTIILILSITIYFYSMGKGYRNRHLNIITFSIIFYIIIILYVNYKTYITYHLFGLALQGRYNFPVLSLITIFIAYNLLKPFSQKTKTIITITLTSFLVYNNYFWFLSHVRPDWFMD
jgi:hypothetical protein